MQKIHNASLDHLLKQIFDPVLHFWLYIGYRFFKSIGIIRHNTDVKKINSGRARVLREEAERRGIKMTEIKPFNMSINLYKAKMKNRNIYFMDMPRPDTLDKNLYWIDDKFLFKKLLAQHNLPHAKGDSLSSLHKAIEYFHTLQKPVIIKPRLGSRSRHTNTGISDIPWFKRAFKIAKQLCYRVIVEEQLPWPVYRGTLIGGKLIAVLGGTSPQVIGDGMRTIEELIALKNQTKHEQQANIKITDTLKNFLKSNSMSLESVPSVWQIVKISAKSGIANGGESFDITEQTHPDNKHMLELAAKAADSPIIGLDFIIADITKSYKDQKCGIIECNTAPFIQLHHDVMIGKPINVAKYVWDLIDK